MINAELLRKTASLIRSQEEEKAQLSKHLNEVRKEASINRTVLNMIKEGLLDTDEIDAKISEFGTNPDLLDKTASFFDRKTTSAGTVKDGELPEMTDADAAFLQALQS